MNIVSVPLQLDVTFNLTKFHAVTMCIAHPFVVSHENGTPSLVLGPMMLTQNLCTASYAVLADYIHGALRDLSVDMEATDWRFDFVTDGEKALYAAFQNTFRHNKHTLCVRHLIGNIKRFLKNGSKKRTRVILGGIFGVIEGETGDDCHYIEALVDATSGADYKPKWEKFAEKIAMPAFAEWFVKNHQEDFIEKLIDPHRQIMGFRNNLPHTNYVEALHKLLKAFCGTHTDVRFVNHP